MSVFGYSVRGADAGNGIRVFIPDIGMFIAGLVSWLLCRSLEKPPVKDISQLNTDFETDNQAEAHAHGETDRWSLQIDELFVKERKYMPSNPGLISINPLNIFLGPNICHERQHAALLLWAALRCRSTPEHHSPDTVLAEI
ncbi:hypothetical protein AOLI_G00053060 [Acnodon oligacanthus]